MKYEYHDTIYNMDKFLSIYKGGKITVNGETTWRALGVASRKGNLWFNESNVIFRFDNENDYNNFLNEYKKS